MYNLFLHFWAFTRWNPSTYRRNVAILLLVDQILTLVFRRRGCYNPQTVFAPVLKNAQPREKLHQVPLSSSFPLILVKKKKKNSNLPSYPGVE